MAYLLQYRHIAYLLQKSFVFTIGYLILTGVTTIAKSASRAFYFGKCK